MSEIRHFSEFLLPGRSVDNDVLKLYNLLRTLSASLLEIYSAFLCSHKADSYFARTLLTCPHYASLIVAENLHLGFLNGLTRGYYVLKDVDWLYYGFVNVQLNI